MKKSKIYYYSSLPSDFYIGVRVPKELVNEFKSKLPKSQTMSNAIKQFMIEYVINDEKSGKEEE